MKLMLNRDSKFYSYYWLIFLLLIVFDVEIGYAQYEVELLYESAFWQSRSIRNLDVDMDGDADLVISSRSHVYEAYNELVYYPNNGAGKLGSRQVMLEMEGRKEIRTKKMLDIHGDGDLDCVVAETRKDITGSEIWWYENDGSGQFVKQEQLADRFQYIHMEKGDIDGDGLEDILFIDKDSVNQTFSIICFYNKKTGIDPSYSVLYSYKRKLRRVRVKDINGDGLKDIAFILPERSGFYSLCWIANLGGGRFSNHQVIAENLTDIINYDLVDLNHQKGLEAVLAEKGTGAAWVYNYVADKGFEKKGIALDELPNIYVFYFSDFNEDGYTDIMALTVDNAFFYINQEGKGWEKQKAVLETKRTGSAWLDDWDQDGDDDLLVSLSQTGGVFLYCYENKGNLVFQEQLLRADQFLLDYTQPYDWDQDGDQDILGIINDNIAWIEQEGKGHFKTPINLLEEVDPILGERHLLQVQDVNQDGKEDFIYWAGVGSQKIQAYIQTAPNHFSQETILTAAEGFNDVQLVDNNQDGQIEIVYTTAGTNQFGILSKDIGEEFKATILHQAPENASNCRLQITSINDAVDKELLGWYEQEAENQAAKTTHLFYLKKELENWEAPVPLVMDGLKTITELRIADIDQDQDIDIVFIEQKAGVYDRLTVLFQENQQFNSTIIADYAPHTTKDIALTDVTEDERLDIVLMNQEELCYYAYQNGDRFAASKSMAKLERNKFVDLHLTDIEGDGDIDVVLSDYEQNQLYAVRKIPTLSGWVYDDVNNNCERDVGEAVIPGVKVLLNDGERFTYTDNNGSYSFDILTAGSYELSFESSSPIWAAACPLSETILIFDLEADNLGEFNLGLRKLEDCPLLTIHLNTPVIEACSEGLYYINYCNQGTQATDTTYIRLFIPEGIILANSIQPSGQDDRSIDFNVGYLGIGECGQMTLPYQVSCDLLIGSAACMKAMISPSEICADGNDWDGSDLQVQGICEEDSIRFTLTNIGTDMSDSGEYRIYEDDLMTNLGIEQFQLEGEEVLEVVIPANGGAFRMIVEQSEGHPIEEAPQVVVELCGQEPWSLGHVTSQEEGDGASYVDIDCQEIVAAHPTNAIFPKPEGIGNAHVIRATQDLEYKIYFENNTTDTVYSILIEAVVDTGQLAIQTATPMLASHPYDFEAREDGGITFLIENVAIPPASIDALRSTGFIQYAIEQVPDNEEGEEIKQDGVITFGTQNPYKTNFTHHTIGVLPNLETRTEEITTVQEEEERVLPCMPRTNPVADYLVLDCTDHLPQLPYTLLVYDLEGRRVKGGLITSPSGILSLADLREGYYVYHLLAKGEKLGSGKFIIVR